VTSFVDLGKGTPCEEAEMTTILWLVVVVLVISGVVTLVRGQLAFGILLIVAGFSSDPVGSASSPDEISAR
jgi:hypothetical protein